MYMHDKMRTGIIPVDCSIFAVSMILEFSLYTYRHPVVLISFQPYEDPELVGFFIMFSLYISSNTNHSQTLSLNPKNSHSFVGDHNVVSPVLCISIQVICIYFTCNS